MSNNLKSASPKTCLFCRKDFVDAIVGNRVVTRYADFHPKCLAELNRRIEIILDRQREISKGHKRLITGKTVSKVRKGREVWKIG